MFKQLVSVLLPIQARFGRSPIMAGMTLQAPDGRLYVTISLEKSA